MISSGKWDVKGQVPGNELPVLERMMKAQTTESEKTDTQVFSVYISIASVKENRVRFSAQLRIRSASAAYSALPCKDILKLVLALPIYMCVIIGK